MTDIDALQEYMNATDSRPSHSGDRHSNDAISDMSSGSIANSLVDKLDSGEALGRVFGFRSHMRRAYVELCEQPGCTVDNLAQRLGRDQSNVNRSLKQLQNKGLADRRRSVFRSGGQVYYYWATDPAEVQEMMHEALDEQAGNVHRCINEFGVMEK